MHYIPLKEDLFSPDLGYYQSFGICALERQGDVWREMARISDVSVDPRMVSRLCEKCNRGGLALVHLRDVVEDFIG